MKKIFRLAFGALVVIAISGCALLGAGTTKSEPPALYDLGTLHVAPSGSTAPAGVPPLSIAEVNTPAWLDSPMMYFRLAYANEQQPRPYAASRWAMPPAQLFGQRLKSRLAQAGGVVLSAADGAANVALLRIEADDFTQVFDGPGQSSARIALRATVFEGRTLVAQKSFLQQAPAPSPDAAGGARALMAASDAVITDMMAWLAALPLKK